jgi:N6-adenosine-specific RNA methylase IME4
MEYHEYANIFPLIEGDDFNNLKEDIRIKGQSEPIVLFEGKVLDGRNRLRACEALGLKPVFKEFKGDDALGYVISNNLRRRHLTESQRACIAQDVLPLLEEQAKKRQGARNDLNIPTKVSESRGESRVAAARTFSVGTTYISDAKKIKLEHPELYKEILRGSKNIHEVKSSLKKEARHKAISEQKKAIAEGKVDLPKGLYEVIVIDPPWHVDFDYSPDYYMGRVANPYPDMSIEELKALKLPASDDCVLWLWATHSQLWNAKLLMDAWGFEYKCVLVWDKESMGIGKWLRKQCEFCLLGFKGKPPWDNTTERDILREQKTNHSSKPESFYSMVDKICIGRKLDYFARRKHKGWDCFGDEIL